MAWWGSNKKDEEIPEVLRNMKPEDIAAAVNAKMQAEADAKTAKDALAAKNTEFEQTRSRLQNLEANLNNINGNRGGGDGGNRGPASFLVDEDQAFNDRAKPIVDLSLMAATGVARMQFFGSLKARDRHIWDKYEAEIDQIMAKDARKIDPNAWKAALTYVKGLHTDDITKPDFFSELGSEGSLGQPIAKPDPDKLTPEEQKVCKKMGVAEADYLKQKKEMAVSFA